MNEFRKRLLIKIGVFLILIIALVSIEWTIGGFLTKAHDDILAKRTFEQDQLENSTTLINLRKGKVEADKDISILANALPSRDGVFTFKDDIDRFAASNGVKSTMIFGNETIGQGGALSRIKFTISASGSFAELKTFMRDVENSRYFTKFDGLELSSQTQSDSYQLVLSGELIFRS